MKEALRALAALLGALFGPRRTSPTPAPVSPAQPAPTAPPPAPARKPGVQDAPAFYNRLRQDFGRLSQPFVQGTNGLLAAVSSLPLAYAAYALATAYHETGRTMQPVHEKGSGDKDHDGEDDWFEQYDTGPKAKRLGNTPEFDGDGQKYAGRGFVQLTGKANYEKAGKYVGQDLVADPDLAMQPANAAAILVLGMKQGWFTGKKLADYLPWAGTASHAQFADARRIINGTDRADLIADYAEAFQDALEAGGWGG